MNRIQTPEQDRLLAAFDAFAQTHGAARATGMAAMLLAACVSQTKRPYAAQVSQRGGGMVMLTAVPDVTPAQQTDGADA